VKKCLVLTVVIVAMCLVSGCGVAQPPSSSSTVGPAGPTGPQGPQGPRGVPGPAGPQGPTGATGATGLAGATGVTGAIGPQGIPGTTGPAGPQGPQGVPGATGSQGPAGTGTSALAGVNFGVQGDSIAAIFNNAWQNVVIQRTGMVLALQDARLGRALSDAFECWGATQVGQAPGVFNSALAGGLCTGPQFTGVTNGETFADSLANIDLMVIALGQNDQTDSIGQLGDATNAGTFYGNLRYVVEAYLTAKPSMRVVFITLQQNEDVQMQQSSKAYADATVAYCNSMAIPVLDMWRKGGVNYLTINTLTVDTVHPSPLGFSKFYGPTIAQFLISNF
jgi:hypothetical protein